ncbi:DICT sensory domain-containing protein [Leptolyngbya sp. FACHB-711]|uniref:DICT sensory domain-containing protein n=1 Tax=unclassified Leptolyngbya TaxID=2650499 RepID=UPI001683E476|nr:DICT sensory domain-containing protein [Leptolyngbya sp. FACHB-711]MBD1849425.1 GAF domain-containing protein [Cyanobacteria bacterium FACHB-502]MBD2024107.1 GAF domain-containing protein [Leptolyngbya sp. FACHB-711]
MSLQTSVLEELLQIAPQLRPQLYFKSSLTALSHAMEDQVLAGGSTSSLVIASFQRERFYRQEAHRYERIAALTPQVYVLAAPETSFTSASREYETIAFEPDDRLSQEWHLVVIGQQYAACLLCQERYPAPVTSRGEAAGMDQTRRFEGIWTFDRQVSEQAAKLLLNRIQVYRPELSEKIEQAKEMFLTHPLPTEGLGVDPDPFAQRLVTYLQAGQYKLLKAYRSIAAQERRERLVNSITSAIRRSLDPNEIFKVAVAELGQAMEVCRCVLYRCRATDTTTTISYEYRSNPSIRSLMGEEWLLSRNPLFQTVAQKQESLSVPNTQDSTFDFSPIQTRLDRWQIRSWLMVPVVYQGKLLGMMELHHCKSEPHAWTHDEIGMVEAIATQLGVALIQAESYANLEDLNQQLEALERTRSNLIAITGHELRTPLSTIQVCLESLVSEPDMMPELRQVMLNTAMTDADRMRKLIQDFLTLSRLESGRVEWHLEPIALEEVVSLALSSIRTRQATEELPRITAEVPIELPPVKADGEWLVEVLSKLLDNACKFTNPEGEVTIEAKPNGGKMLEVTVIDTGRGIEPNRLEAVFDRFYQEEGALRRTAGGTGLGLAICRQIVLGLGGKIWAESAGRDQGSQFHFTLPIAQEKEPPPPPAKPPRSSKSSRSKSSDRRAAMS